MADYINEIFEAILKGSEMTVIENVNLAIDSKVDPKAILDDGMIAAMKKVGDYFENGDYFLPEMLVAAKAMQSGLSILKPHLQEAQINATGKIAIGTVSGDMHDIGKNLVVMMLEGAGFDVIDLGTDVSPKVFVDTVQNEGVSIIGFSALLTTTMPSMLNTIDELKKAGIRERVKVIVGGAPVTQKFAESIGADGYAEDASKAVKLANKLMID